MNATVYPIPSDEMRAMPSARATHAPHRARILGLGLSVGITIALGGCNSPQLAYDNSVDERFHDQIVIDEKVVQILERHNERLAALEARQGHSPNGGDANQAPGASLSGAVAKADAR